LQKQGQERRPRPSWNQALATLQEQIGALQQAQQAQERNRRDVWVAFMAGVIMAGVFFLIIVILISIYRG
jgi:hypothetical protein